jgi:hypothetical protein
MDVVDPTRPRYRLRFSLVSVTGKLVSAEYPRVQYRPGIVWMLRLPVTSLWPHPERCALRTNLSSEALAELVAVAGESGGPCPSSPTTSGAACLRPSTGRSRRTPAPCSGGEP